MWHCQHRPCQTNCCAAWCHCLCTRHWPYHNPTPCVAQEAHHILQTWALMSLWAQRQTLVSVQWRHRPCMGGSRCWTMMQFIAQGPLPPLGGQPSVEALQGWPHPGAAETRPETAAGLRPWKSAQTAPAPLHQWVSGRSLSSGPCPCSTQVALCPILTQTPPLPLALSYQPLTASGRSWGCSLLLPPPLSPLERVSWALPSGLSGAAPGPHSQPDKGQSSGSLCSEHLGCGWGVAPAWPGIAQGQYSCPMGIWPPCHQPKALLLCQEPSCPLRAHSVPALCHAHCVQDGLAGSLACLLLSGQAGRAGHCSSLCPLPAPSRLGRCVCTDLSCARPHTGLL